jgi:hypothetical protein
VARRPLEREPVYLDGGRRTTQLMRDSLGSRTGDMSHTPFRKRIWPTLASILFTSIVFLDLILEIYKMMRHAEAESWMAAVPRLGILSFGLYVGWLAYMVHRTHQVDASGIHFLTLRLKRITIPWSAVEIATFKRAAVAISAGHRQFQIVFGFYQHPSQVEAFVRERLKDSGARVQ